MTISTATLCWGKSTNLQAYHEEINELTIDDNLQSPEVPKKLYDATRHEMKLIEQQMKNAGLATDMTERDGLVLMVTIPASDLFAPNDTMLSPRADTVLDKIIGPLRTPDRVKLLIAVHSDNTGSEAYLTALTQTRAEAIEHWIKRKGIPTEGIVPYGIGYEEPLSTEVSRAARASNRRVEFYFVPGPVMLQQLKAGKR